MKKEKLTAENSTLIGRTPSRKEVRIPDDAKHVFIAGTTGSGKTVALSNYIARSVQTSTPLLLVDGKGDVGKGSILDMVNTIAPNKKKYIINLNDYETSDFYNPFREVTPSVAKDMLINLSTWSEEHYKLNTERYLQRVIKLLSLFNRPITINTIIDCMSSDKFVTASIELLKLKVITKEEHLRNVALAKDSGSIAQDAVARFATIAEADIGNILASPNGIDIYTAMKENAIILFILNPLLYPEISPAFARLALIDAKKAVSKLFSDNEDRIFFVFDEISSYASPSLLDLVNKSRSANVTCVLATQSLSDLDTVSNSFKEQVIENCNNYLVLRQNSADTAERWANILGTKDTIAVTYQLHQDGWDVNQTGLGSARRTKEFLYHPDIIKTLPVGKGIFLSKDSGYHTQVLVNKPF